ncbi:heparin lyase I family protein [Bosea sp. 124]|uniref:heparin lyase I family protein n=1 Tax=Bosea sp. 124 TaxID=2135642 RepID=UPI000D46C8D8|nr:heparin lyase I family protein [Bosea sp. 124]PTM40897.1 polysaccharide lyase-like protein [Bosea sp. 124]
MRRLAPRRRGTTVFAEGVMGRERLNRLDLLLRVARPALAVCALALGALALSTLVPSPPALADRPADPSRLVLSDSLRGGGFATEGGLFYKENAEQSAGRVDFQERLARTDRGGLTLTVFPSCRSPAAACSERAEVWERPDVLAPYDRPVWYGFSMHMDDPLPQDDGRYVMAQWKREILPETDGDYSPFLALRLYGGRLGFTVETDLVEAFPVGGPQRPTGCRDGEARVLSRPTVRQTRALVAIESGTSPANYPAYFDSCAPGIAVTRHADLPTAQRGWIDFVVRSQPGPDGDGHVEIIANGVRIATIRGHIGHRGPGLDRNQYFKFGPYRAPNHMPWSVSYGDFRRGPRCADVIRGGQCPAE